MGLLHPTHHDHALPRWLLLVVWLVVLLLATRAAATNFGHETAFGSGQNGVSGTQIATQVTLAEDGDLQSISAYVKGSASKNLRFAIYSDSGGEPGTLLAETVSEDIGDSLYHWHTTSTPTVSLTAGTYWLALSFEHDTMYYKYDPSGGQTRINGNDAENDGFLAAWGGSTSSNTRRISIYGTCSTGSGGSTFGYDTVGGSTEKSVQHKQIASRFTLTEDATVESITAYVGGKVDKQARYALYADASGEPGALRAQTESATTAASMEWLEIDLPDTCLPAGEYWLSLSFDHTSLEYAYDGGGQSRKTGHNAILNGFLNPWGVSDSTDTRKLSIYATYTPGFTGALAFTDVSATTGFDVQTATSSEGSGLHWADLDADGDLDAIVTGGQSRLMASVGAGASFTASTFGGGALSRQGALLDVDNDGDVDFWHRGLALYANDGLAGFANLGDLGLSSPLDTESAIAADVDGDGWCDLVMLSGGTGNWIGFHQRGAPPLLAETSEAIYGLNDPGDAGSGDYASSGDVNGDGDLDVFYHFGGGKLFLSDGDGTFTENAAGIAVVTGESDKVGSAWGDYDNDSDLDLFVPRYDPGSPGTLWRNDGGLFTDVAATAGVTDVSGQRSCCWGDYDNDGDLDLYVVTHSGASNVLYLNLGDGTFQETCAGTEAAGNGHDAVFVDHDNDGDLDLAVTQQGAGNVLLRNDTDDSSFLKVRLVGWGPWGTDVACIGAEIELYEADGTTFVAERHVGLARGYGGTEPLWVHFGGVDPATTYVVKARFRSGIQSVTVVPSLVSTTIAATTIPQMLTITEPQPPLRVISWQEVAPD